MSRHLKLKLVTAILIACGSVLGGHTYAQSNLDSPPRVIVNASGDCGESVQMHLDFAVIDEGRDKSFIIITRLGTGERSRKLVQARLYGPSNYLVASLGLPKSRVITAEGERVRGPGRVEVYVGGKFLLLFEMERNKHFVSDCRL